jgi:hypothetical protein
MTTDKAAPDCKECRHSFLGGLSGKLRCQHPKLIWGIVFAELERADDLRCGPSGRHFEPREDAPEK